MSQARLSLTVAQSTTLVTLDTARAVLGMDNDSVAALCESGSLQYAFDLRSNTADRREVRIWAESLDAYKRGIRLESDDHAALESIVGHSTCEWVACSRVTQRFCVHRRSVDRWAKAGDIVGVLTGHTFQIRRASLIPFLMSRRIR